MPGATTGGGLRGSVFKRTPKAATAVLTLTRQSTPSRLSQLLTKIAFVYPAHLAISVEKVKSTLHQNFCALRVDDFPLAAAVAATSPLLDWILNNSLQLFVEDALLVDSQGMLHLNVSLEERRMLNLPNVSLNELTAGHRRQVAAALDSLALPAVTLAGRFPTQTALSTLERFGLSSTSITDVATNKWEGGKLFEGNAWRGIPTIDVQTLDEIATTDPLGLASDLLEWAGRVLLDSPVDDLPWLSNDGHEALQCVTVSSVLPCEALTSLESLGLNSASWKGGQSWLASWCDVVEGMTSKGGMLRLWLRPNDACIVVKH